MDFEPLVSVIIPVFNRFNEVVQAVNSVINQTYKKIEIIVVDDGSTDGITEDRLLKRLNNYPIKFIKLSKNYGVSKARNVGIKRASGSWIAFLDSDDIWDSIKLEKELSFLERNREFKIVQTRERWFNKNREIPVFKPFEKVEGDIFNLSLARCMISISSVIIAKELFDEVGLFDEEMAACEDYDLWLRITANYRVGLIDERLMTRYGGRDDQLSTTVKLQDIYRVNGLIKILKSNFLTDKQRKSTIDMVIKKATILKNGAKKHKNSDREIEYRNIIKKYTQISL